jgi:uncharacterized protein YbaR (Trm112 family)
MSASRPTAPGATRTCPHCKATILDSAAVCPGCRHHLRFIPAGEPAAAPAVSAFRIEGVIANPDANNHWEFSVVVAVRNERGVEIARHVVHVGALAPGAQRTCEVSVDVFKPAVPGAGPARRTN